MRASDIINSEIQIKDKINILTSQKPRNSNIENYINYYKGIQKVLDRIHPTDLKKTKDLNKLVINLYKKITNTATYFLFGEDPELVLNNEDDNNISLFEEFKSSYRKAKTGEINMKIGVETIGYSESAEILYEKDGEVKYKFVSTTNEKLYPYYDTETGNFSAFIRIYNIDIIKNGKVVEVENIEVYTEKEMYKYQRDSSGITEIVNIDETTGKPKRRSYNKIPVVYYSMEEPLAWQVKSLLDRFNLMSSTLGDVNDSFAFPIMMLLGLLVKDEETGETSLNKNAVSVLHMENETENGETVKSDAKYLTWDSKPESAIYELTKLFQNILYLTATPNLDFDNLKGIGSLAEATLKLMFTDAIAQAGFLRNVFFSLQRRINIHKELLSNLRPGKDFNSLDISVKFKNPIPENIKELVDNIATLTQSGVMSVETAVINNPYVKDSSIETTRLNEEHGGSLIIN